MQKIVRDAFLHHADSDNDGNEDSGGATLTRKGKKGAQQLWSNVHNTMKAARIILHAGRMKVPMVDEGGLRTNVHVAPKLDPQKFSEAKKRMFHEQLVEHAQAAEDAVGTDNLLDLADAVSAEERGRETGAAGEGASTQPKALQSKWQKAARVGRVAASWGRSGSAARENSPITMSYAMDVRTPPGERRTGGTARQEGEGDEGNHPAVETVSIGLVETIPDGTGAEALKLVPDAAWKEENEEKRHKERLAKLRAHGWQVGREAGRRSHGEGEDEGQRTARVKNAEERFLEILQQAAVGGGGKPPSLFCPESQVAEDAEVREGNKRRSAEADDRFPAAEVEHVGRGLLRQAEEPSEERARSASGQDSLSEKRFLSARDESQSQVSSDPGRPSATDLTIFDAIVSNGRAGEQSARVTTATDSVTETKELEVAPGGPGDEELNPQNHLRERPVVSSGENVVRASSSSVRPAPEASVSLPRSHPKKPRSAGDERSGEEGHDPSRDDRRDVDRPPQKVKRAPLFLADDRGRRISAPVRASEAVGSQGHPTLATEERQEQKLSTFLSRNFASRSRVSSKSSSRASTSKSPKSAQNLPQSAASASSSGAPVRSSLPSARGPRRASSKDSERGLRVDTSASASSRAAKTRLSGKTEDAEVFLRNNVFTAEEFRRATRESARTASRE